METKRKKYVSEWKPVSELTPVEKDISEYGYSKEYIEKNDLEAQKGFYRSSGITGRVSFYEPLELKTDGEDVLFRENDGYEEKIPEKFRTQHGVFANHNNGEFISWLEKDENNAEKTDSFYISGNYCDMFDCGVYSYAVSNLMHMGLGAFNIVRISSDLQYKVSYDTFNFDKWPRLEYLGRFRNDLGFVLAASGYIEDEPDINGDRVFHDKTILFQIGSDGSFSIIKEWNIQISSLTGMVKKDNYLYLGENKMITRVDLSSGEISYYTNKSAEELDDLKPLW